MKSKRNKTTVVRIPAKLHETLKTYAQITGMKMEALAMEAVQEFLSKRK